MLRRVVGNPTIMMIDLVSLLIGFYGIHSNILTVVLPDYLSGGGHWQFLTNLSLVYSLIVFGVGFLAHFFKSQQLYEFKNLIHPIGIALESIVAIVYWPLRIWFLELLVSDPKNLKIPLSTDLAIHLMPIVSLLIDYLVFMPKWTIGNTTAFLICSKLTIAYWFLLKYLIDFENGGTYPYVFLNVDTDQKRVFVFFMVGIIAFGQFLLLRKLYDVVVRATKDTEKKLDRKLKKEL